MKVYIEYRDYSTGGDAIEPEERWSSRTDTIHDYSLVRASVTKPEQSYYYEECELDCDERPKDVYVVLVKYSSGDTFGNSYGHGHIEGVYVSKTRAMDIAESIRNGTYKKDSKEKYVYRPWEGYFEGLEEVGCFVMTLRDSPKDPHEPTRID